MSQKTYSLAHTVREVARPIWYVTKFLARLLVHLVKCTIDFCREYRHEHPWSTPAPSRPTHDSPPQCPPKHGRGTGPGYRRDEARVQSVAGRRVIGRSVDMDDIPSGYEEQF